MKRPGILIALTGYAGSGKDTFAERLIDRHGYARVAFADKVRDLALSINPIVWLWGFVPVKLSVAVSRYGWGGAKKHKSVRRLLQTLGMSVREHCGPNVWVDAVVPSIRKMLASGKNVVITDMRFSNEARAVMELDGTSALVNRPGVGPVNEHVSDSGQAFDSALAVIENEGTKSELWSKADVLHSTLLAERDREANNLTHPGLYIARMEHTVNRSMALAVKTVLSIAAPEHADVDEYMDRHRVAMLDNGEYISITVDDELAGEVMYQDNVVTMEAYIAR